MGANSGVRGPGPGASGRAGRQARGDRTIEAVLDSALRLFGERGLEGFTIHALREESQVSLGSIYHHFGSFDGVAAHLYARCMERLLDALVAQVARARDGRRGVAAVVRGYLAFTEAHPDAMRFIFASSYAAFLPRHAPVIEAAKAPRLQVLNGFIAGRVAAGEIVALPPFLYEMLIIGPVAEVAQRWLAAPAAHDLRLAAKHLPERIWRSVAAQEE